VSVEGHGPPAVDNGFGQGPGNFHGIREAAVVGEHLFGDCALGDNGPLACENLTILDVEVYLAFEGADYASGGETG